MTTRAFQKIYTKIDNITKATVTLRAQGVGNDELATVGGKAIGKTFAVNSCTQIVHAVGRVLHALNGLHGKKKK